VSPILVRPVREQLEHDRLIRHLQLKYKRKFEVALNVGDEQVAPVKIGALTLFPDLVLTTGRKLAGVVEVESGESVNNLEAMYQWVHFSRARVPFHLYVPVAAYETARRLSEANRTQIGEVWTYRPAADGFDLVRMSSDPSAAKMRLRPFASAKPSGGAAGAPKPAAAAKPLKARPKAGGAAPKAPRPAGKAARRAPAARKASGGSARRKPKPGASRRR
jgi:hypothetical protein